VNLAFPPLPGQIYLFLLLKVGSPHMDDSLSSSSTGSNFTPFLHIFHLTPGSRALQYCRRKVDMLWHPHKQVLLTEGPAAV